MREKIQNEFNKEKSVKLAVLRRTQVRLAHFRVIAPGMIHTWRSLQQAWTLAASSYKLIDWKRMVFEHTSLLHYDVLCIFCINKHFLINVSL